MKPKYRRMLRGMKARKEDPAPADVPSDEAVWSLYILECRDKSFYTGVTTNIDRRLESHRKGTASRYTRPHRPVVLVYREECGSRSQALVRECAVKAMTRQRKEELIAGGKPKAKRSRS